MDILDIFKTLAEEPDKVGQRCIAAAKLSINLIFASHLYRVLIGPYVLIDFTELSAYADYLLSGRFLLGLLFIWISQVFLFTVVADLGFALSKWFFSKRIVITKLSSKENGWIRTVFIWRRYIAIEKPSQRIIAGEKIEELYSLIDSFGSSDEQSPLHSLRHSLMQDVWELAVGFAVIYYWVLPYHKTANWLNWLVPVSLVAVPILYVTIGRLAEALAESKDSFLNALKFLQFQKDIHRQLTELGSAPYAKTGGEHSAKDQFTNLAGKEFALQIYERASPVDYFVIKSLLYKMKITGCPVLFFTAYSLTKEAEQLTEAVGDAILVAYCPGVVEIRESVWRKLMKSKRGGRIVF